MKIQEDRLCISSRSVGSEDTNRKKLTQINDFPTCGNEHTISLFNINAHSVEFLDKCSPNVSAVDLSTKKNKQYPLQINLYKVLMLLKR